MAPSINANYFALQGVQRDYLAPGGEYSEVCPPKFFLDIGLICYSQMTIFVIYLVKTALVSRISRFFSLRRFAPPGCCARGQLSPSLCPSLRLCCLFCETTLRLSSVSDCQLSCKYLFIYYWIVHKEQDIHKDMSHWSGVQLTLFLCIKRVPLAISIIIALYRLPVLLPNFLNELLLSEYLIT